MAKLNQIVAVVTGQKSKTEKGITAVHHNCQRGELFNGLSRHYTPLDEEGEQLPSEEKRVQYTVSQAVNEFSEELGKLLDVVAIQDWSNCTAMADVVVDDRVLIKDVPVTYLMFLEKQLNDIHTFVNKLPVLESGEEWEFSANDDCYVSQPVETIRTKKVPKTLVRYEATEHHPAQTDVYTEDVPVGKWKNIKFSGALPRTDKKEMVERVEKLRNAVKFAREEANSTEAVEIAKPASAVLGYVFENK